MEELSAGMVHGQSTDYVDDDDEWATDFDDDEDDLEKFDLGSYQGALR